MQEKVSIKIVLYGQKFPSLGSRFGITWWSLMKPNCDPRDRNFHLYLIAMKDTYNLSTSNAKIFFLGNPFLQNDTLSICDLLAEINYMLYIYSESYGHFVLSGFAISSFFRCKTNLSLTDSFSFIQLHNLCHSSEKKNYFNFLHLSLFFSSLLFMILHFVRPKFPFPKKYN